MGRFETLRGSSWQQADIGHALDTLVCNQRDSSADPVPPKGAWSPWASIFDDDGDDGREAAAEHEAASKRQRLLEELEQPPRPSKPSDSSGESDEEGDDAGQFVSPQDLPPSSSSSSKMPEPKIGPGEFVPVSDVADNIVQNEQGETKYRYLNDEQIFASFTSKRQYERQWRNKKKKKGGKKHKKKDKG